MTETERTLVCVLQLKSIQATFVSRSVERIEASARAMVVTPSPRSADVTAMIDGSCLPVDISNRFSSCRIASLAAAGTGDFAGVGISSETEPVAGTLSGRCSGADVGSSSLAMGLAKLDMSSRPFT